MSSKVPAKFKGKQAPNTISFRFNPIEENLEVLSEKESTEQKTNEKLVAETFSVETKVQDDKAEMHHSSMSFSDKEEVRPSQDNVTLTNQRSVDTKSYRFTPVMTETKYAEVRDTQDSLLDDNNSEKDSKPIEKTKVSHTFSAPLSNKDDRESSPMKECVKEYFAKLGKRSSSFESATIVDGEPRSFFSEITERFAKTLHEKINKDSVSGSFPRKMDGEKKFSFTHQEDENSFLSEHKAEVEAPSSGPVKDTATLSENILNESAEGIEKGKECFQEEELYHDDQPGLKVESKISSSPKLSSGSRGSFSGVTSLSQRFSRQSPTKSNISSSVTLSSLIASQTSFPNHDEDSDEELWEFIAHEEKVDAQISRPVIVETRDTSGSEQQTELFKYYIDIMKDWWKSGLKAYTKICNVFHKQLIVVLVVFLACAAVPVSSYVSGFIMGSLLSGFVCYVYWCVFKPPCEKEVLKIPNYETEPPLKIPVKASDELDHIIHKGWMNELPFEYDPDTYHVNNTQSVYVRLDGPSLRLSRPKHNVPKRAMWNERRHDSVFIHQRHYDLQGASVFLPPEGLARKRLWNKKYPICIAITNSKAFLTERSETSPNMSDLSPRKRTPLLSDKSASDTEEVTQGKSIMKSQKLIRLYLFARSGREKEEWYRRFQGASESVKYVVKYEDGQTSLKSEVIEDDSSHKSMDLSSIDTSVGAMMTNIKDDDISDEIKTKNNIDFTSYMAVLLGQDAVDQTTSTCTMKVKTATSGSPKTGSHSNISSMSLQNNLWLNAFVGRIFYDFFTQEYWSSIVTEKIQRKLSKIRVPYFIEELQLTDIDLGMSLPIIQRVSDPVIDKEGLWIDMDLTYQGSFQMTLKTQLNLLRLKKTYGSEIDLPSFSSERDEAIGIEKPSSKSYLYDSDEEDSAESSSDDELSTSAVDHTEEKSLVTSAHVTGTSTSKKILRFVDKLTQSRYFQQATENKYIKRAMEEVSNTPILLTVEVHGLVGTLAINIPPAPTDRLWYGFRGNPKLSISARPKLGEKKVTIGHVTEWIEKKLSIEFQKLLVMPNMDDLIIPIMYSGLKSSGSSRES
ncbi:testis-expressed protein 2-like isoform X1 [Tachypleus tridentatus]|uniref:testis-expressed protein 2-like isoform X1 n=1 Tax=Tachypleus tridentatus TaxID=6853 RepID=UPI003FD31327